MKKSTILLCLLFAQSFSFTQKMEVIANVGGSGNVTINFESTINEDNIFSSINSRQSISVTNIKTNKTLEKKVYDLNSKIHNLSNLRKNYRDLIVISRGRIVDGNVQFLIQSMGSEDKVNISRTTLDDKLNVVEEKLLLSYDLAHTQMSGPVRTDRTFKYDDQLELYFFGEYHAVPRKDDYLRAVVFNSEMEITSDNGFELKNRDTELDPTKGFRYIGTSNIIDANTVVINIQGTLFRIKNNTFTPIPLNLQKSIDSYVIHSNGQGGIRFVGCYNEDKGVEGFAVLDFDNDMKVTFEKFQNIPEKLNASQKELTGKGATQSIKSRSFYIVDFKVNKDGSTDIVFRLSIYPYLNFTFIKIDSTAKILDQLAVPSGAEYSFSCVFDNGKLVILSYEKEDWYDANGIFNPDGYPNRKSEDYILTATTVSSSKFSDNNKYQVQSDKVSLNDFSPKTQKLTFKEVKLGPNSYLITLDNGSWRTTTFGTTYIGKISF